MRAPSPVALLAVAAICACDMPTLPKPRPAVPNAPQAISYQRSEARWLPVGTIVPVGDSILAPPEPFEPSKHGKALDPPTDIENLAPVVGIPKPPRRTGSITLTPSAEPIPGDGDRGILLNQFSAEWYGVYAVYDLNLSLGLPSAGPLDVYLYAPTTLPPGSSCLEATQVYRRLHGGSTTGKLFMLWDWCESGPNGDKVIFEPQTTAWTNRYARTYQGKLTYTMAIVTPNTGNTEGQCWYANLYDYTLGGWVERWSSCGVNVHNHTTGWSMWESYNLMSGGSCPNVLGIRSLDIVFADPETSTWVSVADYPNDLGTLGPSGSCWQNGTYTFASPVPGLAANTWRANTPNP